MDQPLRKTSVWLSCAFLALWVGGCATVRDVSSPVPSSLSLANTLQDGSVEKISRSFPQDQIEAKSLVLNGGVPDGSSPAAVSGARLLAQNDTTEQGGAPDQSGDDVPEEDEFFDPFAQPGEGGAAEAEEYDPWEPYNVVVFRFNYNLDKYVVKPIAKGYNFVVPNAVQLGISNVFTNVRFAPRLLNNLFQGKFRGAGVEASRFVINSTLGIGGLFDPAENWFELETPVEDFGQTLGVYGVGPGPYFLIPFWPSPLTIRDGTGVVVDLLLDPFNWLVLPLFRFDDVPVLAQNEEAAFWANVTLRSIDLLNTRSLNLETFQGVEEATIDLYSAVRNGYLQRRAQAIRE